MSRTLPVALACALLLSAGTAAEQNRSRQTDTGHDAHGGHASPPSRSALASHVREVTARYRSIDAAIADGYAQFGGCVSGPEVGAMGVHFVNGGYVDGTLDADHPEALIYEMKNGSARLVGVEYITPAPAWDAEHEDVPVLLGQHLQFLGSPNRYRLPGLYELHVWAWRDNPNGTFVDWNPNVTCDGMN